MSAYQRLDGLDEGCSGDLMSFGVAAGTSVDLQISFRNSETGDPMGPLPLFYLSAFDIDGAPITSFALGGGQKVAICLVDDNEVCKFDDPLFNSLEIISGAGRQQQ